MGNVKVFFRVNIKRLLFKRKTILKESVLLEKLPFHQIINTETDYAITGLHF